MHATSSRYYLRESTVAVPNMCVFIAEDILGAYLVFEDDGVENAFSAKVKKTFISFLFCYEMKNIFCNGRGCANFI